jgi:benzodiazapine receptor
MRLNSFFKLIIAIAVCEFAGLIGSFFTTLSISTWYAGLARPQFSPPNWIFAPVWTMLFALMGISLFLVWKNDSSIDSKKRKRGGIILFFIQLFLNVLWSVIFFGLHNPGAAFAELIALWLAIFAAIIAFYKISKSAAWLLVPYVIWVSFAGYLNYSIWVLN